MEAGETQRRPGLHVDCPGKINVRRSGGKGGGGGEEEEESCEGGKEEGREEVDKSNSNGKTENKLKRKGKGFARRYVSHSWGLGGCRVIPRQPHVAPASDSATGRQASSSSPSSTEDDDYKDRSFVMVGGIYMASSVGESCQAWNCKIVPLEGDDGEELSKITKEGKNECKLENSDVVSFIPTCA